eukprot:261999-Prymnesium_polylepis.1
MTALEPHDPRSRFWAGPPALRSSRTASAPRLRRPTDAAPCCIPSRQTSESEKQSARRAHPAFAVIETRMRGQARSAKLMLDAEAA